jgi:hypothetical protein
VETKIDLLENKVTAIHSLHLSAAHNHNATKDKPVVDMEFFARELSPL